MTRERKLLIGLAVLLVAGLLFALASAGQRNAWMEGFMMGRLTAVSAPAEAGAAAAMLPYAPYGLSSYHRGPGVGGIFFLLLGLGGLAFIVSRCFHRARWHAWMAGQRAPHGEWRHGPPPWVQGQWGAQPATAPADQPAQSQPQASRPASPVQPDLTGQPDAPQAPASDR